MSARKQPEPATPRAEPKYRFSPILLIIVAIVSIPTIILAIIAVIPRSNDVPVTQGPVPTASTSAPTPASSLPSASQTPTKPRCPALVYPGERTSIENRMFDFLEASKLTDPAKRRKALETGGSPAGLVVDGYFDDEPSEAPPSDSGSGDLIFVIVRDLNAIDAVQTDDNTMSVVVDTLRWTSCRNGKVENAWVEPGELSMTWTKKNNVWYAQPGQI